MNNMKKVIGILLLFFTVSCSSNLDFNQVNDLKIEPIVAANLASFDVPAHEFVTHGIEQTVTGDLMNFNIFKDTYFKSILSKVDFFFEINNTINRAYVVNLYFLDANNTRLYTIPFNVPAYSGSPNLVTKTEVFENAKLDLLKNATQVAFVVTMLPGPALSESSSGSIKLRSSGTVYLVIQ